jgi:hypothetical protein
MSRALGAALLVGALALAPVSAAWSAPTDTSQSQSVTTSKKAHKKHAKMHQKHAKEKKADASKQSQ